MRTIVSKSPDSELTLETAPPLSAGEGEVVLDVRAIGVGRVDLIMRQVVPTPFVPGIEVAGVVSDIGRGVDPAWRGRRVFARLQGGAYADQVVVASTVVVAMPDALSFEAAVGAGINALVAHFSMARTHAVAGERVLVRGARGGIGHLAVQMAANLGAEVLQAARDGAPQPADVVVDVVGGAEVGRHLAQLNANGRYLLAGISAGMPAADFAAPLMEDFRRSRSIITLSLDTVADAELNRATGAIFADIAAERLAPVIAATFPLEQAHQAHQRLAAGGTAGKIILVP
nr:zinc-binding dehydrogenase [uncultured Devosia sp.]